MNDDKLHRQLFELIGYLLTSARGLIDEPQTYGPFRLIDGVSRLCGYLQDRQTVFGDFFIHLKERIDEEKFVLMTDEDRFIELLDEVVLEYTKTAKELEPG
jgi:hypothetical protein